MYQIEENQKYWFIESKKNGFWLSVNRFESNTGPFEELAPAAFLKKESAEMVLKALACPKDDISIIRYRYKQAERKLRKRHNDVIASTNLYYIDFYEKE